MMPRRLRPPTDDHFARATLRLDAAVVFAGGLGAIVGARRIANLLGLNRPAAIAGFGGALLPYATGLFVAARQRSITRRMLLLPITLNSLWVAASLTIVLNGTPALPTGGAWAVSGVAAVVGLIAAAQIAALRTVR
jgi:hypothetical protein